MQTYLSLSEPPKDPRVSFSPVELPTPNDSLALVLTCANPSIILAPKSGPSLDEVAKRIRKLTNKVPASLIVRPRRCGQERALLEMQDGDRVIVLARGLLESF